MTNTGGQMIPETPFELELEAAVEEELPSEDERPPKSDAEIDQSFQRQSFRVIYQINTFMVPQLADLVRGRVVLNLRPEYQRRLRWTRVQKSRLIESLLLNIPIPPVFFFEQEPALYEVMDGQQRINSIKEFTQNEFKLSGLEVLPELNGRQYVELPPRVRRTLDRASMSAIILLHESDSVVPTGKEKKKFELRRFVFERLNTGGMRLNAQEIRNAVYNSRFNQMVLDLSRHRAFTSAFDIPPHEPAAEGEYYESPERQSNYYFKTMLDVQIVLRFFALRSLEKVQGSMRSMLDAAMEEHHADSDSAIENNRLDFVSRIEAANFIFDGRPFRIQQSEDRRTRPSIGMYDAVMVSLDRLWPNIDLIRDRKQAVCEAYWGMIAGAENYWAFTGQANTAADIRKRILRIEDLIKGSAGIEP